jgi:hypothetical protein
VTVVVEVQSDGFVDVEGVGVGVGEDVLDE